MKKLSHRAGDQEVGGHVAIQSGLMQPSMDRLRKAYRCCDPPLLVRSRSSHVLTITRHYDRNADSRAHNRAIMLVPASIPRPPQIRSGPSGRHTRRPGLVVRRTPSQVAPRALRDAETKSEGHAPGALRNS